MPDPRRNHSLLYLFLPDGEIGEYQLIAESNGIFPSLWQFFFADGDVASADALRVLDGNLSHGICVDGYAALARFERVVLFLRKSPDAQSVAGLLRYLEGALRHLKELMVSWTFTDVAGPVLCANFDEFSRPKTQSIEKCVQRQLNFCSHQWQAMELLMQQRDFESLDRVLRFPELHLRSHEWKAWAGVFGLALFSHRYFAEAFRYPHAGDYEDFDYDPLGSDARLSDNYYRFKEGNRWGVRRTTDKGNSVVLAPLWDRILRAGPAESDLIWVQRDGRFGLTRLSESISLLYEASLDEVHAFENGLAVVRVGSKMGFLGRDGRWQLEPAWDEVREYRNGCAVVIVDHRLGYIDSAGTLIIQPQFDEAYDFDVHGIARVRVGTRYRLIHLDGRTAIECDHIAWSEIFDGWMCVSDGRSTLLHADATKWINTSWDSIEPCVAQQSIRVRNDKLWGLLDWSGAILLACEYDRLEARSQRSDEYIARRGNRSGLLMRGGEVRLPFEFLAIEELEPHIEGDEILTLPHLLRVRSAPQENKPRAGVWDLDQQRYVVPCNYDFIWSTWLGQDDRYGFIVVTKEYAGARQFRVGILRADGSVLVPQSYAWIATRTEPTRANAFVQLRNILYYSWSQGKPVQAASSATGSILLLQADGTTLADASIAATR
jgi:hypothetical protein